MQCVSCESAAYAAALLSSDPNCFVYFLLPIPWQIVKILVPPTILWQLVSGSYSSWVALSSSRCSWSIWLMAEKTWCMTLRYILVQSCSSKWYGHMSFGSHLTNKDFNLFCCACLHHNVTVYTTIGAHVQAHAGFILTQSWSCIFAYS